MYYRIASAAHQISSAGYGDCVTQSPYYTFQILAPAAGAILCYAIPVLHIQDPGAGSCSKNVLHIKVLQNSCRIDPGAACNVLQTHILQKVSRTPGAGRENVLQLRNVTQKEICSKPDPERCRSFLYYEREV